MSAEKILSFLEQSAVPYEKTGDASVQVSGFSSIYHYKPGTLSWLRKPETLASEEFTYSGKIQCLITGADAPDLDIALCQIKVADPRAVFFSVVDAFWGQLSNKGISEHCCIEDGAKIGLGTEVGAFSHISSEATIGSNCRIGSNVTIRGKVHIGDRCVIQSGAVIGEDGFAYTKDDAGQLHFVKHYGGVWIGDDVSIGANACVCRGTIDDTVIMDMAKVDNLCHIAHNVVLEERVEVIAGAVIMGSVHVGAGSWIATSAIRDQRKIGKNCVVGMGAVVVRDVPSGTTVVGNPAKPFERKEDI